MCQAVTLLRDDGDYPHTQSWISHTLHVCWVCGPLSGPYAWGQTSLQTGESKASLLMQSTDVPCRSGVCCLLDSSFKSFFFFLFFFCSLLELPSVGIIWQVLTICYKEVALNVCHLTGRSARDLSTHCCVSSAERWWLADGKDKNLSEGLPQISKKKSDDFAVF